MNMQENQEIIWLEAFSGGDRKAFNAIFNHFYPAIRYFAEKLTGSREEAEDITIDTFAKLFFLHRNFATLANIRAFLYITARNRSLDYIRNEKRRNSHSSKFSLTHLHLEDDNSLQNEMIEASLLKNVYNEIEKLPPQCREVFKMIFFKEMKTAEIARQLKISADTVRSLKRHALNQLRIRLGHNDLVLMILYLLGVWYWGMW